MAIWVCANTCYNPSKCTRHHKCSGNLQLAASSITSTYNTCNLIAKSDLLHFTITVRIEHPLMRDTDHDFLGATPEFNWPLHWETDVKIRKWHNATLHHSRASKCNGKDFLFPDEPFPSLFFGWMQDKGRWKREKKKQDTYRHFPPFFLPSLDLHIWSSEERGKVSHGGLTPNQKWWDKKGFGTVSRESEMLKQDHLQAIINR